MPPSTWHGCLTECTWPFSLQHLASDQGSHTWSRDWCTHKAEPWKWNTHIIVDTAAMPYDKDQDVHAWAVCECLSILFQDLYQYISLSLILVYSSSIVAISSLGYCLMEQNTSHYPQPMIQSTYLPCTHLQFDFEQCALLLPKCALSLSKASCKPPHIGVFIWM